MLGIEQPPFYTFKSELLPRVVPKKNTITTTKHQIGNLAEDPEVNKVFTRLIAYNAPKTETYKESHHSSKKDLMKNIVLPTCNLPVKSYESTEMPDIHLPRPSTYKKRPQFTGDAIEREVLRKRLWNGRNQYPLRSVKVNWHGDTNHFYSVVEKLAPYGYIENLVMGKSGSSATVVFSLLTEASGAVADHTVGDSHDPTRLVCSWLHKELEKKRVSMLNSQVKVRHNPYVTAAVF